MYLYRRIFYLLRLNWIYIDKLQSSLLPLFRLLPNWNLTMSHPFFCHSIWIWLLLSVTRASDFLCIAPKVRVLIQKSYHCASPRPIEWHVRAGSLVLIDLSTLCPASPTPEALTLSLQQHPSPSFLNMLCPVLMPLGTCCFLCPEVLLGFLYPWTPSTHPSRTDSKTTSVKESLISSLGEERALWCSTAYGAHLCWKGALSHCDGLFMGLALPLSWEPQKTRACCSLSFALFFLLLPHLLSQPPGSSTVPAPQ